MFHKSTTKGWFVRLPYCQSSSLSVAWTKQQKMAKCLNFVILVGDPSEVPGFGLTIVNQQTEDQSLSAPFYVTAF